MSVEDVPVLIVGGGPVGLCTSICLSRLGVRHMLVEKHPSTTLHPKARALSPRSMELMRPWGLRPQLSAEALPLSWLGQQIHVASLAGKELRRIRAAPGQSSLGGIAVSPEMALCSAQDVFEPVWLAYASSFTQADLRFGVRLDALSQDSRGVTCTVQRMKPGQQSSGGLNVDWSGHRPYEYEDSLSPVHAQYVIACDGWHSTVRKQLSIPVEGDDDLATHVNVFFHADLHKYCDHRGSVLYWIGGEPGEPKSSASRGVLQPLDGRNRWCCQIGYSTQRGQRKEDFTPERCQEWIRKAVGDPELHVDVKSTNAWAVHATVAAGFRYGRVLLVGDCAHQMPPTGGFGLNAGIADVFNVAWKVAAVLGGWGGDGLLDTYDSERRAASRNLVAWALQNPRNVGALINNQMGEEEAGRKMQRWSPAALDMGAVYASQAVLPDGFPVSHHDGYVPSGRPGGRAPHLRLRNCEDNTEMSALDLSDCAFAFLTPDKNWVAAARAVAHELRVPLNAYVVSAGDVCDFVDSDCIFRALYGVGDTGAVLVRPDGHIGWRVGEYSGERTESEIRRVLCSILHRSSAKDAKL